MVLGKTATNQDGGVGGGGVGHERENGLRGTRRM